MKTFRSFFKTLYEVTASTNKDILNSSIRKHVAGSLNKESMNKKSSKNVFLRF